MNMTQYAVKLDDVVKRYPNPDGGEVVAVDYVALRDRMWVWAAEKGDYLRQEGPLKNMTRGT